MADIIVIQDVDVKLTYPDSTTETITLESPNAENDPFQFGFRKVRLQNEYRAGDGSWNRGWNRYQFKADYNYVSHAMNLWKFLIAEEIQLKIPPPFRKTADYQKFDVTLSNSEMLRSWFDGLVMAETAGESIAESNPVPSGGVTLNFVGKKPFTESEVRAIAWQPNVTAL